MKTKMKVAIMSLLMFFSTGGIVKAQMTTTSESYPMIGIGIRYMPTITSLEFSSSSSGVVETEFLVGYGIGGVVEGNFSKHVGLQGEFIFNSLSQKYKDRAVERKVRVDYINVPVLLSLNTSRARRINLNVSAGPQIGLNVGANVSTTQGSEQDTVRAILAVKQGDFGFAYGAGLELANRNQTVRFDFGFRGVFGLIDISDDSQSTQTESFYILEKSNIETYSLYFGLTFLF